MTTFTEEQYKQIIKDLKEGVIYNGDMMRWNGGPLFDPSEIITRLIEENECLRTENERLRETLADYCARALQGSKP